MDNTLPVWSQPWIEHSQVAFSGTLWTVSRTLYQLINIVLGVIFALTQPFIERIIAHLIAWFNYWCCATTTIQDTEDADETTHLNPNDGPSTRASRRNCCAGYCSDKYVARFLSVMLLVFVVGYSVTNTTVTRFTDDDTALSGSKTCGAWSLKGDANPAAQDADSLVQGQRETRAGQYARDCYGSLSAPSMNQCSIFRQPNIPTTSDDHQMAQECPFENATYCWGNGFEAVRFTTAAVDAKSIGINAARAPTFNRTTICVPLNMNAGFVERPGNNSQQGEWAYRLGPVSSDEYASNYTFRQYGDPFYYDVRSYTMSTYVHVYSKKRDNYWQPIPELNVRRGLSYKSTPHSLTLMFINSCRIFYKESSDDPIFPADRRFRDSDLWVNNDSRARPLACIDWVDVCTTTGECSSPHDNGWTENAYDVFTRYALMKSNAFNAIEFRGATGLDAQYRIQGDISLPLSKDHPQWVTESWRVFNTSLARIQFDALDIANGTDHDKEPLYTPTMPAHIRKKMCRIFTFQIPKGYNSIRIYPLFLILAIPFALAVLGRETGRESALEHRLPGRFEHINHIMLDWLMEMFEDLGIEVRQTWRRIARR